MHQLSKNAPKVTCPWLTPELKATIKHTRLANP